MRWECVGNGRVVIDLALVEDSEVGIGGIGIICVGSGRVVVLALVVVEIRLASFSGGEFIFAVLMAESSLSLSTQMAVGVPRSSRVGADGNAETPTDNIRSDHNTLDVQNIPAGTHLYRLGHPHRPESVPTESLVMRKTIKRTSASSSSSTAVCGHLCKTLCIMPQRRSHTWGACGYLAGTQDPRLSNYQGVLYPSQGVFEPCFKCRFERRLSSLPASTATLCRRKFTDSFVG